mmetsp:Transcript_38016/g.62522  ORF Transcript_38016/g.62522 Transcript_38016/m.62522 type:complete len:128 (+) Transcript_38016:7-390(+)
MCPLVSMRVDMHVICAQKPATALENQCSLNQARPGSSRASEPRCPERVHPERVRESLLTPQHGATPPLRRMSHAQETWQISETDFPHRMWESARQSRDIKAIPSKGLENEAQVTARKKDKHRHLSCA